MGGRKMIKAAGGGGLASTSQAYPYMNYIQRQGGGSTRRKRKEIKKDDWIQKMPFLFDPRKKNKPRGYDR